MILDQPLGNNIFHYDERVQLGGSASITIPPVRQIFHISEIVLGDVVVFEEIDHRGRLQRCTGLDATYVWRRGDQTIIITDHHNHVLYRRLRRSAIHPIPHIIHIDQHSDLGSNPYQIDMNRLTDDQYCYDVAHLHCHIGNFIMPMITQHLVSTVTQVRTESLLLNTDLTPGPHDILDIDIDFWAAEMHITHVDQTIQKVRKLISQYSCVTIATSPFFIPQHDALGIVRLLLQD